MCILTVQALYLSRTSVTHANPLPILVTGQSRLMADSSLHISICSICPQQGSHFCLETKIDQVILRQINTSASSFLQLFSRVTPGLGQG